MKLNSIRSVLIAILACPVFVPCPAAAEVKLPAIFSDHMVLQRDAQLPVWGWAEAGEAVTIELDGQRVTTKADDSGAWKAKLAPVAAGGPHTLVVAGKNRLEVNDVLVGEVWICSGQSNMEWSVSRAQNAEEEISAADHPRIRMMKVGRATPSEPQKDCSGRWQVCAPKTAAGFSAVAYYFGRELQQEIEVPIGLINSSWGGTICEAWTSGEALEAGGFNEIIQRGKKGRGGPNRAAVLYNGMIAPLVPYRIQGAIWYQGESNRGRAEQYGTLFPAMITDWRKQWAQGDFPFYFVQLAPFRYGRADPLECAELREAQNKALALPNTGVAVTMDIGNPRDIHPRNKQDVGRRLALWALAKTYGKKLVYSGPLYKSHKVDGNKIRVTFQHVGSGLKSRDEKPLSHFEIAGEDKRYVPATATIEGDSVVVTGDIAEPVAVRYGWRDDAQPNLANTEGLPASPFRTDDWPLVTAGRQ